MPRRQSNAAEGGRGCNSNALSVRNVAEGGRGRGRSGRGRSIRIPGGGWAAGAYYLQELPPGLAEAVLPVLGVWPAPQSTRDKYAERLAKVMDRPSGFTDRFVGGVLDPGLARRVTAAIEAEAFAAACETAARTSLDSAMSRLNIFRLYGILLGSRLTDFGKSNSTDPDAAFDALGLGVAWREWKTSSSSSATPPLPLPPPPPAAPAPEPAVASSSATAPPPAAAPPSHK